MNKTTRKAAWMAVGGGAAMLAGHVVQRSLDTGYRAATADDPPKFPRKRGTGLTEAILWTAGSAVIIALAQILAEQGAVAGWRHATGRKPPQ